MARKPRPRLTNRRTGERRLPYESLQRYARIHEYNFEQVAAISGTSRSAFQHYIHTGIPMSVADRIACRLGVHPETIWHDFQNEPHHPREIFESAQLFEMGADR